MEKRQRELRAKSQHDEFLDLLQEWAIPSKISWLWCRSVVWTNDDEGAPKQD